MQVLRGCCASPHWAEECAAHPSVRVASAALLGDGLAVTWDLSHAGAAMVQRWAGFLTDADVSWGGAAPLHGVAKHRIGRGAGLPLHGVAKHRIGRRELLLMQVLRGCCALPHWAEECAAYPSVRVASTAVLGDGLAVTWDLSHAGAAVVQRIPAIDVAHPGKDSSTV